MFKSGEVATLGVAGQLMELHSHLEGHFDRRGAVVRIKNAAQGPQGKESDQLFGQSDGRFVGQAEKRAVGKFRRLLLDGLDNVGVRMTVNVGPDRTVAIEVFAAGGVDQHAAASFDQDEGIMPDRAPVPHLGERMPEVRLVGLPEFVGGHGRRA
jgi:hypothetical protein